MCYAKPGPRCVSHIRQSLTALSVRAEAAEMAKRRAVTPQEVQEAEEKVEAIKEEIRDALFQYDGTSEGIARLVTDGVRKGDMHYHQERIDRARLYRDDQFSLYLAASHLKEKPGRIARALRSRTEEGRELLAAESEWSANFSAYMKTAYAERETFERFNEPGHEEGVANILHAKDASAAAQKRLNKAVANYAVTKHAIAEYKAQALALSATPDSVAKKSNFTRAIVALNHTVADYRLGKVAKN